MNQFLAELYNTAENISTLSSGSPDIEKLAEAEILNDLLTSEGVDIDKLSGDTLVKVAAELFGDQSALVKVAQEAAPYEGKETPAEEAAEAKAEEKKEEAKESQGEGGEGEAKPEEEKKEEKEEEAKEAAAQADFMGRLMAHSFVNEWANLEKAAQVEAVKTAKIQQLVDETPEKTVEKLAEATDSSLDEVAVAIDEMVEKKALAMAEQMLKEAGRAEAVTKAVRGAAEKAGKTISEKAKGFWQEMGSNPAETFRRGRELRRMAGIKDSTKETMKDLLDTLKAHKTQAGVGASLAAGGALTHKALSDKK